MQGRAQGRGRVEPGQALTQVRELCGRRAAVCRAGAGAARVRALRLDGRAEAAEHPQAKGKIYDPGSHDGRTRASQELR